MKAQAKPCPPVSQYRIDFLEFAALWADQKVALDLAVAARGPAPGRGMQPFQPASRLSDQIQTSGPLHHLFQRRGLDPFHREDRSLFVQKDRPDAIAPRRRKRLQRDEFLDRLPRMGTVLDGQLAPVRAFGAKHRLGPA